MSQAVIVYAIGVALTFFVMLLTEHIDVRSARASLWAALIWPVTWLIFLALVVQSAAGAFKK